MKAAIHKPSRKILSDYIEYFLVLKNDSANGFYKTFPNTNLCLALYKQNSVSWNRQTNICDIERSQQTGTNKLFGSHKKPFSVFYSGKVEQVCILFKLEGISFFSKTPINRINPDDNPFEQLFGQNSSFFIEQLFSETDEKKQVELLEIFLIQKIKDHTPKTVSTTWALHQLQNPRYDEKTIVNHLAGVLAVNTSTLYRHFLELFGQTPMEVYKTIRFRKTLTDLMAGRQSFTKTAYSNNFFDQSHLVKDIRQFTGETPRRLLKNISNVEGVLLWLKN